MKKEAREGYKMTELGEIPNEWQIKNLEDISCLIDGDRSSRYPGEKDIVEHGILFLSTQNIIDSKIVYKNCKFITEEKFDELSKGKLQKNDLIITLRGSIGNVAKFNGDIYDTGFINAQIMIIRSNDINPTYLSKYLISVKSQKQITSISSGSAQPQLTKSELKKLKVIVPSEYEQKKIVEILSNVDEQIENTEKLIQKNEELKKGLMQQLLTKGIGHTEFKKTYLGDIPKEWHIINFFEFVNKIIDFRGRTPKKLGMDWGNGTILALSANNVKMGKIDFNLESYYASNELYEKWMRGNELSKGDLVMTMEAPLGNIAQIPDDEKYILSQRVVALKTNDNIDNEFMKYMLMSNNVQNQLDVLSTGTTAKGINQKNLSKVLIALPKIEEQRKIASILSSIDKRIEQYKDKKEKLEEVKRGLMQDLLLGKIRVI